MNTLRNALVVILISSTTAIAAPASESSIKQLLAVTQAKKLLDGVRSQFDLQLNNAVQQALKGRTPTPNQQLAITNMKNKMVAVLQDQLTWEKYEPIYLNLYKESFTEEEVAGMLAFYQTPAGQAVINKMPVLMQKTMHEIQAMMSRLAPQMEKIQQTFAAEMAAASK
jgi:hypothetical protein